MPLSHGLLLTLGIVFLSCVVTRADDNLFDNAQFEMGLAGWGISCPGGTSELSDSGPEGATALTLMLPEEGDRQWSFYRNVDLSLSERYQVSFFARSDKPLKLLVAPQRGEGDFSSIGDGATATIESEWKEYQVRIPIRQATSSGRITFLGIDDIPPGVVQFANFRLESVE